MNEWNIQSRSHACQSCERPFADGESCQTLLLEERHQYVRMDVCRQCWETQYGQGAADRKGFISQWHSVYHAPPPAAPEAIRRETAEDLLRKLIAANQPKDGPVCFILAVMLERKRILKVKEQFQRDGARVYIYEQPATGDLFTITDPNLHLDQLEQVQREVAQWLNPPAAPAPAAPAPAVPVGGEEAAATSDPSVPSAPSAPSASGTAPASHEIVH
jgi:hypothetical protein